MANTQEDPAIMYRQIFGISRTVKIEFLGVWVSYQKPAIRGVRHKLMIKDTVSSLGEFISSPEEKNLIADCSRWHLPTT
jgi:hypothetical protein